MPADLFGVQCCQGHLIVTGVQVSCDVHKNFYRGADKSLARPGRKQATATKDFEF